MVLDSGVWLLAAVEGGTSVGNVLEKVLLGLVVVLEVDMLEGGEDIVVELWLLDKLLEEVVPAIVVLVAEVPVVRGDPVAEV